jgi:hypothetical protein
MVDSRFFIVNNLDGSWGRSVVWFSVEVRREEHDGGADEELID